MIQRPSFQTKQLNQNDLNQVAKIHLTAFSDSVLSLFGVPTIVKYYEWQMDPPNTCYAVGAFEGDKLLGFSFAGVLRNAEVFFIKENLLFILSQLLWQPQLLLKKAIYQKLILTVLAIKDRLQSKKVHENIKQDRSRIERFGILSTAVDPKYQGFGIGKLLTQDIELFARKKAYPSITMTVHMDNEPSIKLHEKLGYKKWVSADGKWHGIMKKDLPEEPLTKLTTDSTEEWS